MKILGIESSCDDTSVALLECNKDSSVIISEKTADQINIHKKYGGVVPELAGRAHAEKIVPLIESILENNGKPDAIAVTSGPGLITGLLVGVEAARTLSYIWDIPLISVNHIEGHIASVEINNEKIQYPALALVASGGHTELIHIPKQGEYVKLGSTKDDASGECFDKVAKLIDFPYPGGPHISKMAEGGNEKAIEFPRPMINQENFDFSFSGLKTSALYWLKKNNLAAAKIHIWDRIFKFLPNSMGINNNDITVNDFCASFQQAIVDVLVVKTMKAIKKTKPTSFILAGGVSANTKLKEELEKNVKTEYPAIEIYYPEIKYAMDNAAMIAVAGYYKAERDEYTDWDKIIADPNWKIT